MPICRRLFKQDVCLDFSFACDNAGRSMLAKIAMIAITTSSSINVKPRSGRKKTSCGNGNGPGFGMRVFTSPLLMDACWLALLELLVWGLILIGYHLPR